MKRLALVLFPAIVGCGGTLFVGTAPPPPPPAEQPAPPTAQADVEVDPIATGEPDEVQATSEPPDPVYEEQTDSPNPGWVWIPGYWGWTGVDWSWNWGHWVEPVAGQFYIEPYYERVGDRVVYVHGYWGPRDAPRRSYGGERIHFVAATRPANYHRGEHVVIEHRAGPPPGKRPGGSYEKATGTVRPMPKNTQPAHRMAAAHEQPAPRGGEHETVTHETTHETVKETTAHPGGQTTHETVHETTEKTTVEKNGQTTTHETTHETVHTNTAPAKAAPTRAAPATKKKK